jgi:5'-deoxynucleotidase YfbR-like HD superfamily hydrolase
MAALHHDSHEAYLCDIPKPLKRKITVATNAYDRTCDALDFAIAASFGFEFSGKGSPERKAVKDADQQALLMEAARLLIDGGEALRRDLEIRDEEFKNLAPLDDPLLPADAEGLFLRAHAELTGSGPGP